jgi:ComF family protein
MSVPNKLRDLFARAVQFVSPTFCRICDEPAEHSICADCFAQMPHQIQFCWQCALPFQQAEKVTVCGECLAHPPPFERILAPFRYQPPISEMISRFKYQAALHDGRLLGSWLGDYVQVQQIPVDLIIPLPLHSSRLRQRGFNQAAELAHWISRIVQVPWRTDILLRCQQGSEQQGLPRRERQRNIRRVFQVAKAPGVMRVALVDDVVTTGATVRAAARCLRQAGVSQVFVWAVARTPKPGMA